MPAAALWDMDGTLLDSEPLWIRTERAMLDRYGLSFSPGTEAMLVGSGLTAAAKHFQDLGVPLSVEEIIAEWADGIAAGLAEQPPQWRPGARELLASFTASGVPCALVTMSVRRIVDVVLEHLPEGTFTAVVAGDEVEHEKPHPDPYVRGAAALGVAVADCVAFEDSHPGLASATAAGAVAIGVPNQVPLEGAQAHEIWSTLDGVDANAVAVAWARHRTHDERNSEVE